MEKVAFQRAVLGVYQNGFTHHISNLAPTGDNLASAESVIRDVDVAIKKLSLTKNEILQNNLSHSS